MNWIEFESAKFANSQETDTQPALKSNNNRTPFKRSLKKFISRMKFIPEQTMWTKIRSVTTRILLTGFTFFEEYSSRRCWDRFNLWQPLFDSDQPFIFVWAGWSMLISILLFLDQFALGFHHFDTARLAMEDAIRIVVFDLWFCKYWYQRYRSLDITALFAIPRILHLNPPLALRKRVPKLCFCEF